MIKLTYNGISYVKLFAENVNLKDALRLIVYRQARPENRKLGFIRRSVFTLMTDLTISLDDIFKLLSSTTKNEIRKVDRQYKLNLVQEDDINEYIMFYNRFAQGSGLETLNFDYVKPWEKHLFISKTAFNEETISMHAYITDYDAGRARLWTSSRNLNGSELSSQEIGYINRWHHWKDIEYFKNNNFKTYDFGGYAHNTTDKKMDGINKFKTGFSKHVVEESNYFSLPLCMLYLIKGKPIR